MTTNPYPEFGPFSSIRFMVAIAAAAVIVLAAFYFLPAIDITVSSWFFAEVACPEGTEAQLPCGSFSLENLGVLRVARAIIQYLPVTLATLLVVVVLTRHFRSVAHRSISVVIMTAVAALAIGPGLIVNGILKPNSGRPRPRETDLFGGEYPFVPAGKVTDFCSSNCSFVSGESSAAFWLLCLVPLVPYGYRTVAAVAVLIVAGFGSVLRIAFGGHYTSDVLLGALVTLFCYAVLAIIVSRWAKPSVT